MCMILMGVEPTTFALLARCSNQLSYRISKDYF